MNFTKRLLATFLVLFLIATLFGCAANKFEHVKNLYTAKGTNIICFGDSLTRGQGAAEGEDYPTILQTELGLPVINSGVNGDTTFSALKRLESDVLDKDPKIVIVELGANDYLAWGSQGKGPSTEDSFKNLKYMVKRIQREGAVVLIAAIPFNLEYQRRYKKLAKETGSLLIPDVMRGIFGHSEHMSIDRMHPNAKGYRVMAENILEYLGPLLKEMGVNN